MQDDSKACFAIIRHNVRTYESGGVVAVIKGRTTAENILSQQEKGQGSEDRHAGWRYFLEKTDLKPGMDPVEATNLRQTRLEVRESEAQESLDPGLYPSRPH
ncbi:MAG: hypothetical protein JWO91_1789 [Acidobacteriaceae bacterium]|jgi:hypothetical protein|nr:hypothetical protein [Acidobacteriaceae bacterium]